MPIRDDLVSNLDDCYPEAVVHVQPGNSHLVPEEGLDFLDETGGMTYLVGDPATLRATNAVMANDYYPGL